MIAAWPIPHGRFLGHRLADGGELYYDGDDFETRLFFYRDAVWKWRRAWEASGSPVPTKPPPIPERELLLYSGRQAAQEGHPGIPPLHVHDAGRWAEDIWLEGWLEAERERVPGRPAGGGPMTTTWRELLKADMERRDDPGPIVHYAPSEAAFDDPVEEGFSSDQGPRVLAWSECFVYFPCTYDGTNDMYSAPRNPTEKGQRRVGGGGDAVGDLGRDGEEIREYGYD